MKKYQHLLSDYRGDITAEKLLDNVRRELNKLKDTRRPLNRGGDQMHRSAVIGKNLTAFRHARNKYDQSDTPWRVEVRVDGQYVGYGWTALYSKDDADSLCADFNSMKDRLGIAK